MTHAEQQTESEPLGTFTIPVAFCATGQPNESAAAQWVCDRLAEAAETLGTGTSAPAIDCWWMPNHSDIDGNDNTGHLVWDDELAQP